MSSFVGAKLRKSIETYINNAVWAPANSVGSWCELCRTACCWVIPHCKAKCIAFHSLTISSIHTRPPAIVANSWFFFRMFSMMSTRAVETLRGSAANWLATTHCYTNTEWKYCQTDVQVEGPDVLLQGGPLTLQVQHLQPRRLSTCIKVIYDFMSTCNEAEAAANINATTSKSLILFVQLFQLRSNSCKFW